MGQKVLTVTIRIPIPAQSQRARGLKALQNTTINWMVRQSVQAFLKTAAGLGLPTADATFKTSYVTEHLNATRKIKDGLVTVPKKVTVEV